MENLYVISIEIDSFIPEIAVWLVSFVSKIKRAEFEMLNGNSLHFSHGIKCP